MKPSHKEMLSELLFTLLYPAIIGTMLYDFLPEIVFPLIHGSIKYPLFNIIAKASLIAFFTSDYVYAVRVEQKAPEKVFTPVFFILQILTIIVIRYIYWRIENVNNFLTFYLGALFLLFILYILWSVFLQLKKIKIWLFDWVFCVFGVLVFGLLMLISLFSIASKTILFNISSIVIMVMAIISILLNYFFPP
jgi:hypothetical protein